MSNFSKNSTIVQIDNNFQKKIETVKVCQLFQKLSKWSTIVKNVKIVKTLLLPVIKVSWVTL